MPADPWKELLEGAERLQVALATLKRDDPLEQAVERLRTRVRDLEERKRGRPVLTLVRGGRDDA